MAARQSRVGSKFPNLKIFFASTSKQQIMDSIPSFSTQHLEFEIRDFRPFGGNFDFCGTGPILGGLTPIFFCCPIIAYIFGSYNALPLNPDFWVDLKAQMIASPPTPPALNSNKKGHVN